MTHRQVLVNPEPRTCSDLNPSEDGLQPTFLPHEAFLSSPIHLLLKVPHVLQNLKENNFKSLRRFGKTV